MAKPSSRDPAPDDLKRLSDCLKKAMRLQEKASGLSVRALCAEAGLSRTTWMRLQKGGGGKPQLDVLEAFVTGLEVSPESWRAHKLDDVFPVRPECFVGRSLSSPQAYISPLHYTNQFDRTLHGRDAETARLSAFLTSPAKFSWWLITGREGAGKSRLATHLSHIEKSKWETIHHKPSDGLLTQRLDDFKPRAATLIIVDYAGMYPEEVRRQIEYLARSTRYYNVRLLLVERYLSAIDPNNSHQPAWYRTLLGGRQDSTFVLGAAHSGVVDNSRGTARRPLPSLHLGPLTKRAAIRVIADSRKEISIHMAANVYERIAEIASRASDSGVHFQPLQLQILAETLSSDPNAVPSLDEALSIRTARRLHYWSERLRQHGHDHTDCDKFMNMLFVATLCHGLHIHEWSRTGIADLLPTETQHGATRDLLETLDIDCDQSQRILPLEPDLVGEWFVRVMVEGRSDSEHERSWRPLASNVAERLIQWAFHSHPESVKHFRGRIFPAFKESDLWEQLTSVIGRYPTPFGKLFDDPKWQAGFLGGQMTEAGAAYETAVTDAIKSARTGFRKRPLPVPFTVLVDLMAGGANRVKDLLTAHKDLRLLAVDQDTSRLNSLEKESGGRLAVYRKSICGRCGIDAQLREAFRSNQCDVVIARKAMHELPWLQQQALIHEVSEVLRPGGRLVLHVDGPHRMSEEGRLHYERLAAPLLTPKPPAPESVRSMRDLSLEAYGDDTAAIFINLWIKLKDWKCRNERERRYRYFSSAEEISRECGYHGLLPVSSKTFAFEVHAARFNEDGINELYYLSHRRLVRTADFNSLVRAGGERFRVLVEFTETQLKATPTNAVAQAVRSYPTSLDMSNMFPNIAWEDAARLVVSGPAFKCPMHILVFEKAKGS